MAEAPIAETSLGKVKGRSCVKPKPAGAKQAYRYGHIPFAKPPVGDLRFEPPQKAEPWDGVLDGLPSAPLPIQAQELGKDLEYWMCVPNEFDEDMESFEEDCLYLNVWTSSTDKSAKLPVMVWLYGGGFQIGGAKGYDGNVLASLHDVVVVVPNYRISAFGFLSFAGDDSPCKGNMGLLDQAMALEWVRDNISSFGGDPNNVTIFGESAGSISVSLQVHSPLTRGLFHRAISHSGVCDFPMLMKADNDFAVNRLLKELKIEDEDKKVCLEKLKKVPAKEISDICNRTVKEFVYFCPLKHDGKFFPQNLDEVMKDKSFTKVPYIIGVNSTEGLGLLAPLQDKGFFTGLNETDALELLGQLVGYMAPPEKCAAVQEAIINEYGRGMDKDKETMYWSLLIGNMNSDCNFVVNSIKMAGMHADTKAPTYFYWMTQSLRYNHDPDYNFNEVKKAMKPEMCECDHGDDLNFTFGFPLSNAKRIFDVKFTDEETLFSEIWMKYVVNFAYTGNPNKGPNEVKLEWPQYDTTSKKYLESNHSPKVKQNLIEGRVKFWSKTFPALLK